MEKIEKKQSLTANTDSSEFSMDLDEEFEIETIQNIVIQDHNNKEKLSLPSEEHPSNKIEKLSLLKEGVEPMEIFDDDNVNEVLFFCVFFF